MANQVLGLGSVADDDGGDTLRAAADKINDNFLEIYTLIGDASSLSTGISATASVITLSTPTIATPNITGTAVMADLDISGDVDVDGTLEADAITVDGVALATFVRDTVGTNMLSSNTESGITVTYDTTNDNIDFAINASQTGITSLTNASLVIGRDADNDIDFATDNNIIFRASGTDQIKLIDGVLAPVSDAGVDLGTSILEFKDEFFDGTVTSDAFAGPLTGNASTATALETARTIGGTSFDGSANIAVALASVGTAITVADESSDTTCFPLFATAATGDLGAKSGSNLTFNSNTGLLTATLFAGALTGNVTGNASGTAATVTGAAQTAITSVGTLTALQVDNININTNTISTTAGTDLLITPVAGQQIVLDGTIIIDAGVVTGATSVTSTAFVGDITGDVTGTADVATVATTVTITDNESTNEDNAIIFTAGGDVDGGNIGLESDGTLTYNPSTGKITATGFVGALTGNASGTAATVTGAAQTAITSVGTLTALQVDNLNLNGNTLSSTAGTDLLITPLSGQQIVLDGAIVIDAGVVTGGTSITSTAFVGALTGNASGTAATVTGAAQTNITSVGTLTALQVDNININLNTISSTAGTDLLITPLSGQQIVLDGTIIIDAGVVTGATSITSTAFVGNVTGNLAGTVSTATQNSITTATGLVSVGALNSGSITSGFTSIDVGAGAISTTGAITYGSLNDGTTALGATAAELNILDASAGNVAVASDVVTSAGAITSNNAKISHTITLNANLADDAIHADIVVTSDKCLATSVVMASSSLAVGINIHTIAAGSFKVSITNLTGAQMDDDSTLVVNYRII